MQNTKDKSLIGAAGVHFVTAELCRRGLIALPTIRNTSGIDVIVTNRAGNWHANVQVKTSLSHVKFWPVGESYKKFAGPRNWYVFVRFLKQEQRFEAFLERSNRVVRDVKRNVIRLRARGHKWTSFWPLPRNETRRNRLRRQWERFGISHANVPEAKT